MSNNTVVSVATSVAIALSVLASGAAQAGPRDLSSLMVPAGTVVDARAPLLAQRKGEIQISVRLTGKPLAAVAGSKDGTMWSRSRQNAYLASLETAQSAVMSQVVALGGKEVVRLKKAHNALIVSIDARKVPDVAKISGVAGVRRVINYELSLSETVPYIGASAVQASGFDGSGVRVAVIDSGIDFTHFNLGGPGTTDFYDTCYAGRDAAPVGDCATYFGAAAPKVVGGYDFVGETWPDTDLVPDPNPIDLEGHGTHVADIIAGRSADGTHKGVAPGASLYAVKACSAISSSCSGVALLQAVEFTLDPNGDGDISDAVDVVNMSLGSSYGQREDDLSAASAVAAKFGVMVVVSAGNSADRPFITGSPSTTPEVLSVAQTNVPSAVTFALQVNAPAAVAGTYRNTNTVDWAPITSGFSGDVIYTGDLANPLACTALPAGSLTGKVALVDRGTCAISIKVHNAAVAGAIGVLVANNQAGDAPTFSFGGPDPFVPAQTLTVTQATGNALRTNRAGLNVTVSPSVFTALVGSMVASSSRGPSYSFGAIKPEIGAPGASLSAEAGTGNGQTAFGGTSGAAPMVSGAAALLLQAKPTLKPHEVKAQLVNSADSNILTNPATLPGVLAPITRIGGGEVRANAAVDLTTGMWDAADPSGVALSFGAKRVTGVTTYRKKVLVRNYAASARTYTITPSFRYANDAASGAATVTAPASIAVPANGSATFTLSLRLDASKVANWPFTSGGSLGTGALLNGPEIDGYLTLSDAEDTLALPWHLLPHKASNVVPATTSLALGGASSGTLGLSNTGAAVAGEVDVYSLDAVSPKLPATIQPRPGDNYAIIDLKSVGSQYIPNATGPGNDVVLFAINTWGERSHPSYPAEFDVYVDSNNDGTDDFVVFNRENGAFGSNGQNIVTVINLATGAQVSNFFSFSDLSSANVIMPVFARDVGLMTAGTKFTYTVYAFDNYFTGALTDFAGPATVTPNALRFVPAASFFTIPIGGAVALPISRNPAGDAASPSQSGLLLMYSDGKTGAEASAITITP
jgi:subtilisin family serine protease